MNTRLLKPLRCFALVVLLACAVGAWGQGASGDLPQLPATGMVYVVEGAGAPVQVHASETKFNSHAGGNFARSFVYAGPQSSMEIEGVTSKLQLQVVTPVFYVRLTDDDLDIARRRVTLVAIDAEKKSRTVMTFSRNVFGGSHKRYVNEVPVVKTDTSQPGWLKVTPVKPLDPDDYAIVFLPADVTQAPTVAYDFSVAGKRKVKAED